MKRTIAPKTLLHTSTWMALGLCAFVLSACTGLTSVSSLRAAPLSSQAVAPLSGSATPTPIPFVFQTVNDPNSSVNRVMGINERGKVVGTVGRGSGSDIPGSYSALPPYPKFRAEDYPGAQGTSATSLTSNRVIAGYVVGPQQLNGVWAFVRTDGVWTLLKDRKEGTGSDAVTEILGINDSYIAVGFYVNSSGAEVPVELNAITERFTNLKPPGAVSAQATGINGKGNITGTETLSNGSVVGFFLQTGTYYPISYPGAQATQALGLNWQDQVVGDYEDASGAIHGFVLTYPTNGGTKQYWQSVDEPNAGGTTVITGMNNHSGICGWYVDGSGNVNGFVASP